MSSGSLKSGYATALSSSASDAAKKMKGGTVADALDAFDSAIALAKTKSATPDLRRVASSALNFVRNSPKTTEYLKKNTLPRMQQEFSEVFGSDITESGQTLREVSAYRLGKRFGAAAVKKATGVAAKASGAAKTDVVRRGGKSISVRRDIGGAGGGQFVNALTSMRQSMARSVSLARRAQRHSSSERSLYDAPSDSPEGTRLSRRVERLRGSLYDMDPKSRRDRLKQLERRRRERKAQAQARAKDVVASQPKADPKPKAKPKTSKPKSRVTAVQQEGNTEISSTPDLYTPSDFTKLAGGLWDDYPSERGEVERGLEILDQLLVVPPNPAWGGKGNTSLGTGVSRLPVNLERDASSIQNKRGHFRFEIEDFGTSLKSTKIGISAHDGDQSESDNHRASTLLHEFGHYLDFAGFANGPSGEFSYGSDRVYSDIPLMENVIDLIASSDDVIRLRDFLSGRPDLNSDYWLSPEELWARAFTQWAITRSGDTGLLEGLLDRSQMGRGGLLGLGRPAINHWDPESFSPIAEAMDELFREAGWLR